MAPKPVIAFREWGVTAAPQGLLLAPRHGSYSPDYNPWATQRAVAKCRFDHTPGAAGCQCGLYGWFDIPSDYQQPVLDHNPAGDMPRRRLYVFGAFIAWGEVSKHRRGIRAQFAKPVALRWSRFAEECAENYPGLVIADTPGELKAAALSAGGELLDPASLPTEGKGEQGYAHPREGRRLARGGMLGTFTPAPAQQRLKRLVSCTLILGPGIDISYERNMLEPGVMKMTIPGVDQRVWVVSRIQEQFEAINVPMIGTTQVEMKTGRTVFKLRIKALLDDSQIDRELTALAKVGTIFSVNAVPASEPPTPGVGPLGMIGGEPPYEMSFE